MQENHWLLGYFRESLLGTLLPFIIALLTLFYDYVSSIRLPKSIRIGLRVLCSPFQSFLVIEDLEEPVGGPTTPSVWKTRLLAVLAMIGLGGWLAYFVYAYTRKDGASALQALAASTTWVRVLILYT
jgi:hypothetical protein